MARASWSGALTFGGFPINVRMYPRVKSRAGESFKTLAPTDQQPVKQQLVDSSGQVVAQADCLKGVEVGKNAYHALPEEAIEMIGSAERSVTVEPEQFAPLASVRLDLSVTAYEVVPDEKVPGSDVPARILWNGLKDSGLAYITEIVMRAGSRDAILAVWADENGIHANALPYEAELQDVPTWDLVEDEGAAETFQAFVNQQYADKLGAFDHSALQSRYKARRAEAVQAALKGEKIEVPEVAQAKAAAPDLMAAMQASLAGSGAKKAPAKKAAKKSDPVKA